MISYQDVQIWQGILRTCLLAENLGFPVACFPHMDTLACSTPPLSLSWVLTVKKELDQDSQKD